MPVITRICTRRTITVGNVLINLKLFKIKIVEYFETERDRMIRKKRWIDRREEEIQTNRERERERESVREK